MSFSYEKAKQQLQEEQAKLRTQLERLKSAEYQSIGYSNHMADDATDAFDQAVDMTLRRDVETLLESVEKALAKFDQGTYGLCEACGARIDRARLEALPYARHCLDCQARREHGRKATR